MADHLSRTVDCLIVCDVIGCGQLSGRADVCSDRRVGISGS